MKKQYAMLNRGGITTICVFRSTPTIVNKYVGQTSSLIALSDTDGGTYARFTVGKSTTRFMQDGLKMMKNIRKYKDHIHVGGLMKEIHKGRQLPADFIIDEQGIIVDCAIGSKILDFERLESHIPKERRCNCNAKDCISPRCRETHAEILRESERMLYIGAE